MAERKNIQLAYPFEERRIKNEGRYRLRWYSPYLVQPKLDGERCRMIVQDNRCLLLSSSEGIISSVPHINKAGLELPWGEYDGELYVHGWTWAQIHSVVSRETSMHEDYESMQFHMFDLINTSPQSRRLQQLNSLQLSPPLFKVPTLVVLTLEEIYSAYDEFISKGYEGFIVRHLDGLYQKKRSLVMMKFKPKQKDTYIILSVYEAFSELGNSKGMIGGFNCMDDMGTPFSVSAGHIPFAERHYLWKLWREAPEYIRGKKLEIEYQSLTSAKKVPRFGRAVKIIEEVI